MVLVNTIGQKERLEARVGAEQKQLFQQAANLLGRSLTDFIVSTLQEAASRIVQEHEILRLVQKDKRTFISSLVNPPKPSKRLMKAAERYKKQVVK